MRRVRGLCHAQQQQRGQREKGLAVKRDKVSNKVRRTRQARANQVRNRTVGLYAVALKSPVAMTAPAVESVESVVALPERHVTKVTPVADGKHQPSCSCGWSRPPMTERGAKGQATRHRNDQARKDAAPVAA